MPDALRTVMNLDCKFILLCSCLLFLQACASGPRQSIAPVPVEDRTVEKNQNDPAYYPSTGDDDSDKAGLSSPAEKKTMRSDADKQVVVLALLEDSKAKMASGDKASAAATLERALRLAPKNAMLWYRLGLLRLQQKNWQQAINLAKKSNSLAAGNYPLQSANWKLIAQANYRAGDKSAARRAADMASRLEQHK